MYTSVVVQRNEELIEHSAASCGSRGLCPQEGTKEIISIIRTVYFHSSCGSKFLGLSFWLQPANLGNGYNL